MNIKYKIKYIKNNYLIKIKMKIFFFRLNSLKIWVDKSIIRIFNLYRLQVVF